MLNLLAKNKLSLILIAASLSVGYLYYSQTKDVATLEQKLKQRKEQLKIKDQEIVALKKAHKKQINALISLGEQEDREERELEVKTRVITKIIRETADAPESKDWSSTPLPENVIDKLRSIHDSVRNSVSAGTDTSSL